ncbi:hypothetical protein HKX48_004337 [Thoreauomyces humboldtii]|nr:hypothetical protein HKX48_004337 [Thoreauomyces humboldtii]
MKEDDGGDPSRRGKGEGGLLAGFLSKPIPGQELWSTTTPTSTTGPRGDKEQLPPSSLPATATETDVPGQQKKPFASSKRVTSPLVEIQIRAPKPASRLPVMAKNKGGKRKPPALDRLGPTLSLPNGIATAEISAAEAAVAYDPGIATAVRQWKAFTMRKVAIRRAETMHASVTLGRAIAIWRVETKRRHLDWRFEVKADVHHRYVESRKVWIAWREYVAMRSSKATQHAECQRLANLSHTRMAWTTWRALLAYRRQQRSSHLTAVRFHDLTVLIVSVRAWRDRQAKNLARKRAEETAAVASARRILRDAFVIWKTQHLLAEGNLKALRLASQHDANRKASATLHAWKEYVGEQRRQSFRKGRQSQRGGMAKFRCF